MYEYLPKKIKYISHTYISINKHTHDVRTHIIYASIGINNHTMYILHMFQEMPPTKKIERDADRTRSGGA